MTIWWHSSGRVRLAIIVALLGLVVAGGLLLAGFSSAALALFFWVVITAHSQLYPWYYARVWHGREVVSVINLLLLALPWLLGLAPLAPSRFPWIGLGCGFLLGCGLFALHWRDLRILLHPQIIAIQPRITPQHAVERFLLVSFGLTTEELFYRVYLLQVFASLIGPVAIVVSAVLFNYGDWAGSWGPSSNLKQRLLGSLLGIGLGAIYLYTGSLWGILLAHTIYNFAQLLLPPLNVWVHSHQKEEQPEILEINQ